VRQRPDDLPLMPVLELERVGLEGDRGIRARPADLDVDLALAAAVVAILRTRGAGAKQQSDAGDPRDAFHRSPGHGVLAVLDERVDRALETGALVGELDVVDV